MRLELSSFVAGDLAVIADYTAEDNPARALSFIKELRAQIRIVGKVVRVERVVYGSRDLVGLLDIEE